MHQPTRKYQKSICYDPGRVEISRQAFTNPEELALDITASKAGFVEVYVYNSSASPVWYDQFSISSTQAVIIQENHYYPFGMQIAGLELDLGSKNRYLYNGKELQDDHDLDWHDYGARMYDAQIGRWHVVDPMADQAPDWTPYRYGFNNPIRYTDPTGLFEDDYTAKQDGTIERVKTDDDFDRFFVENKDGSTTQVAQLDRVTASDGKTALVKFPESGNGFTRYGDEEAGGDRYVQPAVAASLFGAINEFRENNPGATIQLGNMSSANGGKPGEGVHTGGGLSHVNGRNVDLRLIRADRALSPVTVFDSQFDRSTSQSMVNSPHAIT